jgi:hypothetical protein
VAVNAEAQADLEEEVLPEEASDQEKKVDSEAIEIPLQEQNVQIDREEKADLIATVLKKKHQVLFKEKAAHQDVQKVQLINQQAVHLRLLKAEGRGSSRQFQFVYPEKEIIITPFFTYVLTEFFFEILNFDF